MGIHLAVAVMALIPLNLLSLTGDVPVYTDNNWTYQASGMYGGHPELPAGMQAIFLHPKYAQPLKKMMRGVYPRNYNAYVAVKVLANEIAHARGLDQTDRGGFDGGIRHRPVVMRLSSNILRSAGAPPKYQKWALRRIKLSQSGRIIPPATPPPTFPLGV